MFGWKKKYNEMVTAYDTLQERYRNMQLLCTDLSKQCTQMQEQLTKTKLTRSAAAKKAAQTRKANKEKIHE